MSPGDLTCVPLVVLRLRLSASSRRSYPGSASASDGAGALRLRSYGWETVGIVRVDEVGGMLSLFLERRWRISAATA